MLRRLQADADGAGGDDAARPALRPDRAVRPVRAGERRQAAASRSAATRSRRCGGASGRRRAATASSCRPTSTSSTGTPWPPHYEAEMPAGHRRRAALRCRSRRCASRSTTARSAEGFYRGIGLTDPEAVLRAVDKLDKIGPAEVAELLAETAGATEAQAKACLALAEISAAGRVVRRRRAGARRERPAARRGPGRAGRGRGGGRASTRPASAWPTCSIARGLDYYTGTVYETAAARVRAVRLDLLRRPLRQPGQRRQRPRSPAWASRSA